MLCSLSAHILFFFLAILARVAAMGIGNLRQHLVQKSIVVIMQKQRQDNLSRPSQSLVHSHFVQAVIGASGATKRLYLAHYDDNLFNLSLIGEWDVFLVLQGLLL